MKLRIRLRYPALAALIGLLTFPGALTSRGGAAAPIPKGSPPAIVGIAHVALRTGNRAAALHFYSRVLGFDPVLEVKDPTTGVSRTFFKVNDHQYIEVVPDLRSPDEDRLINIGFETTDARALRQFLSQKGAADLGEVRRTRVGDLGFMVRDPEGHPIEFVQYLDDSQLGHDFGKDLSTRRISTRIIHAGITVRDRAAEDRFYKNDLGFSVMWYGGMTDSETDWVDMRVPNGSDWLEYMLNVHHPTPRTLGVMHHLALGVPSVEKAYEEVVRRGLNPQKPKIGRDGKWQLNLYDPDGTRVELMEPKPVRTPCCSPML